MKKLIYILRLCFSLITASPVVSTVSVAVIEVSMVQETNAQTTLFQGYGKNATGGKGGTVLRVTNLNDSGTGSLRAAVQASGARTIVFDVCGDIILNSELFIDNDNITIAGNTACGGGIALKVNQSLGSRDFPVIQTRNGVDNVIIRHIRIRHSTSYPGGSSADGIYVESGTNIVLDHLSVSQYGDEGIALAEYTAAQTQNITVSNCIIGWGFTGSSKGSLATGSIKNVTYFQNYFTWNNIRTPAVAADWGYPNEVSYAEIINNVTLGGKYRQLFWNNNGTSYFAVNSIGNLFRNYGFPSYKSLFMAPNYDHVQNGGTPQEVQVYPYDNYDAYRTSPSDAQNLITQDVDGAGNTSQLADYGRYPEELSATPFPTQMVNDGFIPIDGRYIMDSIRTHVGASLPLRDSHDATMISDWDGSGGADKELGYDVPATITLASGTAATDTDNDGIPDSFETANGWNPNLASNNVVDSGTGLTHLEVFIYQDILGSYVAPTNTIPVITLTGASTINLTVGDTYTELGANGNDAEDGVLTVTISGTVNTAVAGTYIITYSVTDSASVTVSSTRTVIVSAAPVVTPIINGLSKGKRKVIF